MKDRLGCLTGSGVLAAVLTALIVGGVALVRGGVLFSPGALNGQAGAPLNGYASHASIDGKCSACHTAFWEQATMADRCTTCHTDVVEQWKNPTTLHGSLHRDNPGLACRACHPDHRGPEAALTSIGRINFAHDSVGFALSAHPRKTDGSPFLCNDCHSQGYTRFDLATCSDCHQQIDISFMQSHVQAYGSGCLNCHDGVETFGHNFDHSKAVFPLTGKHLQVKCVQCHTGARSIADMRATSQDCNSCHHKDDAHAGQLGVACADCHTTSGWKPSTFDHNLSAFKLTGKHAGIPCTDCHKDLSFKGTPTDCNSCHAKDDPHQGRLGTACDSCHTTVAWVPSTFNHDAAAFKLTGKHAQIPCTDCHNDLTFVGAPTTCYACHAKDDFHKGQYGTDCGLCHSTDAWQPAHFDHSQFFPLTGAHASLACSRCHISGNFTNASKACAGCHADPAWHAGAFGTACAGCHNTSAWTPAAFNRSHPGGCGEDGGGSCVGHGGASCRDCHTASVFSATCAKCHGSNNPSGDGGGGSARLFVSGIDLRKVILSGSLPLFIDYSPMPPLGYRH